MDGHLSLIFLDCFDPGQVFVDVKSCSIVRGILDSNKFSYNVYLYLAFPLYSSKLMCIVNQRGD